MFRRLVLIIIATLLIITILTGCSFTKKPKIDYELDEHGIIKPEFAKKIIKNTSNEVMLAIKNKDAAKLANYVHPKKGVKFTPYTYVSVEEDIIFTRDEVKSFFTNPNKLMWGHYDGIGTEIILTPMEYYERFIYSEDFLNAEEIGYNVVLSSGNMLENQFDVYSTPIIVEYYFPNFNPEFVGMDWKSLRLVFEEYNGKWLLVGVIHNQWTI